VSKSPSTIVRSKDGATLPKSWLVIGEFIVMLGAVVSLYTVISANPTFPTESLA
jgi:hypothetical protein